MHTRNHPLTSVRHVLDAMFQGSGVTDKCMDISLKKTSAWTFINQLQCLRNFMYAAASNFPLDTFWNSKQCDLSRCRHPFHWAPYAY